LRRTEKGKKRIGLTQASYSFGSSTRRMGEVLGTIARSAEENGFDSMLLADHLMQYPRIGPVTEPVLESWTTLGYLATRTRNLRLGTLASNNGLRNPGYLAKIAATLDILSNGRLILGMGSGSIEEEHVAYGIHRPSFVERTARLREAVDIVRLLWTRDRVTFKGKYYDLQDAVCNPKPLQKPHPLIIVGGNSSETLRAVAGHTDACNLTGMLDDVSEKLEELKSHCGAVGRDFKSLLITTKINVIIGEDMARARRKAQLCKPDTMSITRFLFNTVIGGPTQVAEKLEEFFEIGVDYIFVQLPDAHDLKSIRLLGKSVLPSLAS